MYTREHISLLAEKWLNGSISNVEKEVFEAWYNRRKPDEINWLGDDTEDVVRKKIFEAVNAQIRESDNHITARVNNRFIILKWTGIAVSILLVVAVFFFYLSKPQEKLSNNHPTVESISLPAPPSTVKAIITLVDGSQRALDHLGDGESISQEGSTLKKSDAVLVYSQQAPTSQNLFNKITVLRGSQLVSLVLSDGTKVWLNVESSLRYPVAFSGSDRRVTLTGEAYFEVSKKKEKFIVETAASETEVLGTHFNVNSYQSDSEQVTLLEGLVKVRDNTAAVRELKPGEQAVVVPRGIQLKDSPDLEAVLAWKNGLFKLNNADIHSIMQQLAQWYDVDVVFKGKLQNKRFSGMISRYTQLPVVLEMLSMTKDVRFKTEGKTITVYPY